VIVTRAREKYPRLSERQACRLIALPRSTHRRRSIRVDPPGLRGRLRALAEERRRFGNKRLHVLLRREGFKVNRKRIYRIYREERLSLRIRKRKRIVAITRVPLPTPTKADVRCQMSDVRCQMSDVRWSMDFVSDQLGSTGRRFRCLNVVDDFSRECLAIEVDTSLPGERVSQVLERLVFLRGKPDAIVVDNGPEFTGRAMDAWAFSQGIKLD
jgi:putative transposase